MGLAVVAVLAGGAMAQAADGFAWKDLGGGRLELRENGKVALIYNYEEQLKAGAPEDRRRCCYLFPVYTPAGVSVLDDFPVDHYHHRGLFWAWPVVRVPGVSADSWMMRDVHARFEKILDQDADADHARLVVRNGWRVTAGGANQRIVQETVTITVHKATEEARELEITIELEAIGDPVTIAGSQEQGKSYGGLSARLAPRTETKISADDEPVAKDSDLVRHSWAEIDATYGERIGKIRITNGEMNPGGQPEWCLREYGFIGAAYPGQAGTTITPGTPLRLSYTVRFSD
jgi:hypothetical protein